MLMSLGLIADITGGRLNNRMFAGRTVDGVISDSRKDCRGKLFVPIVGERANGNDFIEQVLGKGAVCSFCSEHGRSFGGPVIYVLDGVAALRTLAAYYRSRFSLRVFALTGSVGKTTTKDLIASVLSRRYRVMKTPGNMNTDIGMSLSLFDLTDKDEAAVVEMGTRNFGDIKTLCDIAKPESAAITNIGVSHIENLGSREGILRAKREIADNLSGGFLVLNGDDGLLRPLAKSYGNAFLYGSDSSCDFYADNIRNDGFSGIGFTLHKNIRRPESIDIYCPVPGAHMVSNCLCAAAAAYGYGLGLDEIRDGIAEARLSAMRLAISELRSGATLINDAYNASPSSMRAAFDVLRLAPGRKIAVLGDMFELGSVSESEHRALGEDIAGRGFDILVTVGRHMSIAAKSCQAMCLTRGLKNSAMEIISFDDNRAAADYLSSVVEKGDTLLLKASRGMGFETIADALTG